MFCQLNILKTTTNKIHHFFRIAEKIGISGAKGTGEMHQQLLRMPTAHFLSSRAQGAGNPRMPGQFWPVYPGLPWATLGFFPGDVHFPIEKWTFKWWW